MTPEQREQIRAARSARLGDNPRPPGSGGPPRGNQEGPTTRTVYLLEKEMSSGKEKLMLKPVKIKAGISDGSYTEVVGGLKEGDVVVTGVNVTAAMAAAARPPVGASPFGGGGFRGGR